MPVSLTVFRKMVNKKPGPWLVAVGGDFDKPETLPVDGDETDQELTTVATVISKQNGVTNIGSVEVRRLPVKVDSKAGARGNRHVDVDPEAVPVGAKQVPLVEPEPAKKKGKGKGKSKDTGTAEKTEGAPVGLPAENPAPPPSGDAEPPAQ